MGPEDAQSEQWTNSQLPLLESVDLTFSLGLQGSPPQRSDLQRQLAQDLVSQDRCLDNDATSDSPDTCVTQTSNYGSGSDLTIDDLGVLGLDQTSIARLLERYLSSATRSGIFCVLAPWQETLVTITNNLPADLCTEVISHEPLSSLCCALLAIALQADSGVGNTSSIGDTELLIDTLRVEALKSIPKLTWKSRTLNFDQALVLLLLSHVWCLKEDLSEISNRWTSLARIIWQDLQRYAQNLGSLYDVKNSMYDGNGASSLSAPAKLTCAIELATLLTCRKREQNVPVSVPPESLTSLARCYYFVTILVETGEPKDTLMCQTRASSLHLRQSAVLPIIVR